MGLNCPHRGQLNTAEGKWTLQNGSELPSPRGTEQSPRGNEHYRRVWNALIWGWTQLCQKFSKSHFLIKSYKSSKHKWKPLHFNHSKLHVITTIQARHHVISFTSKESNAYLPSILTRAIQRTGPTKHQRRELNINEGNWSLSVSLNPLPLVVYGRSKLTNEGKSTFFRSNRPFPKTLASHRHSSLRSQLEHHFRAIELLISLVSLQLFCF